ncbi:MAG: alpha/beta hydrolase [Chitinophagaceae bacterium]
MLIKYFTIQGLVLSSFFISSTLYSQSLSQNCMDCRPSCLCKSTIGNRYTENEKAIIKSNWSDFEGEDLENSFPISKSANIMSIRFDGLGCVYPTFIKDNKLKSLFFNDGVRHTALNAFTFYSMFRKFSENSLISKNPAFNQVLKELSAISKINFSNNDDSTIQNFFDFREKWNSYFLSALVNEVNDNIKQKLIKYCVFFVHGYNVPYSLAHLQGNTLFKDILDSIAVEEDQKKILFIRVFWPSNSKKEKLFGNVFCSLKNKLNLNSGKLYSFITNRAYLISLSLRSIINQLDRNISINLVSHSFGAVVTTGIVLHPINKIKKLDRDSPFNKKIIRAFDTISIPSQKVSLFLSAPGIPGNTTFCVLDKEKNKDNYFYIGYNNKDMVLKKKNVPFLGWFLTAKKRNSTTLGCNWRGEIDSVKAIVDKVGLSDNFIYCQNGLKKNHDFFCYRLQEPFKRNFGNYVRTNLISR